MINLILKWNFIIFFVGSTLTKIFLKLIYSFSILSMFLIRCLFLFFSYKNTKTF